MCLLSWDWGIAAVYMPRLFFSVQALAHKEICELVIDLSLVKLWMRSQWCQNLLVPRAYVSLFKMKLVEVLKMNHKTKWTHSSPQQRILFRSQKALKMLKRGLKKLV